MKDQKLNDSLGYNIHVVSHFIQNVYNQKLGEYDLTHSQAKVIYFLATCGQQTQTDLQNKLYIKPSSINGVIDSLLKHERIRKQPSPEDKRTKLITLTEDGEKLYDIILRIIRGIENDISQGLSEEEQNMMVSCLQRMQDNLRPSITPRRD